MTRYRAIADRELPRYQLLKAQAALERKRLREADDALAHALAAQAHVSAVAQKVQEEAHARLASVVTDCLRSVFGESAYEFAIRFERKRGRTEARLVFLRGDAEIDPTTASGGGVVDVASFALRLAALILARPKKRRLLVLDEPLRFLSKEYRPHAARLIERLSKDLGVQVVMASHDEEFQIGRVVRLG